ncbi:MAG: methionine adenosyltransferase [Chloroflexi bacterium]|nr:methionine adenosyltransferase [Chloroflexota bacterium]
MSSPRLLLTSESVTEGHPDKMCDQISDAILDALLRGDPTSRVACETATTTGLIAILGEITSNTVVDYAEIARQVVRRIGYNDTSTGFDAATCGVLVSIKRQSTEISDGVNKSLETREQGQDEDEYERTGAGDQGMMVGFACNEVPGALMPLTIYLAQEMARRLAQVRKDGVLTYLRPDGKSQVTVEYEFGLPKRLDTIVIATQHAAGVDNAVMAAEVRTYVIEPVVAETAKLIGLPAEQLLDAATKVYVNTSGSFVIGGPMGDAGLTGRKIIVDTYGGIARHGGGAFSGKDPTKVDRSGAYAARYVAKNIVASGAADRVELQLSYSIGVARPISISLETFGTAHVPEDAIVEAISRHFDLRPAAIIDHLRLRTGAAAGEFSYEQTAAYGHFGRTDLSLPWERTDKADALRDELFRLVARS